MPSFCNLNAVRNLKSNCKDLANIPGWPGVHAAQLRFYYTTTSIYPYLSPNERRTRDEVEEKLKRYGPAPIRYQIQARTAVIIGL